jgi:hypothetical protein
METQHSVNVKKAAKMRFHWIAVTNGTSKIKFERTANISQGLIEVLMGQKVSSAYSETNEIREIIYANSWPEYTSITKDIGHEKLIDVSLNENAYPNPFKNKYLIKLNAKDVLPECSMTILFPCHPDQRKRKTNLAGYIGNLPALSKLINDYLGASSKEPGNPQLVITCASWFVRFYNITGKVYLFWAEIVNTQHHNNDLKATHRNVPVLLETNGQMSVRNVYVFDCEKKQENPLTLADVTLIFEPSPGMFCCDGDTRSARGAGPKTLDKISVNYVVGYSMVTSNVSKLKDEECPFETNNEDNFLLQPSTDRVTKNIDYGSDLDKFDEV